MSNKKIQIKINGIWENVLPQSVKKNDLFRVFEGDGTRLIFPDGSSCQFALEDAYVNHDGTVEIIYGAMIKF